MSPFKFYHNYALIKHKSPFVQDHSLGCILLGSACRLIVWEIPSGPVKTKVSAHAAKQSDHSLIPHSIVAFFHSCTANKRCSQSATIICRSTPRQRRLSRARSLTRRHRKWNSITWLLLCWSLTGWVSNHNTCLKADNKTNFSLAAEAARSISPAAGGVERRRCVLLATECGIVRWPLPLSRANAVYSLTLQRYYKFHVHIKMPLWVNSHFGAYLAFRCTRTTHTPPSNRSYKSPGARSNARAVMKRFVLNAAPWTWRCACLLCNLWLSVAQFAPAWSSRMEK